MNRCKYCGRKIGRLKGCAIKNIIIGNKIYERIPNDLGEPCGNCGADYGNLHHFGCDLESCPKCFGQLAFFCDCGEKTELVVNKYSRFLNYISKFKN